MRFEALIKILISVVIAIALNGCTTINNDRQDRNEILITDDFSSEEYIWEEWSSRTNKFNIIQIDL